jgi:hypothetical protein
LSPGPQNQAQYSPHFFGSKHTGALRVAPGLTPAEAAAADALQAQIASLNLQLLQAAQAAEAAAAKKPNRSATAQQLAAAKASYVRDGLKKQLSRAHAALLRLQPGHEKSATGATGGDFRAGQWPFGREPRFAANERDSNASSEGPAKYAPQNSGIAPDTAAAPRYKFGTMHQRPPDSTEVTPGAAHYATVGTDTYKGRSSGYRAKIGTASRDKLFAVPYSPGPAYLPRRGEGGQHRADFGSKRAGGSKFAPRPFEKDLSAQIRTWANAMSVPNTRVSGSMMNVDSRGRVKPVAGKSISIQATSPWRQQGGPSNVTM